MLLTRLYGVITINIKKCCVKGCEEFKYLGVKIYEEDRQENDIKARINKGWAITAMLNSVL